MRAETRNRLWSAMLWTALAAALAGIVATAGAFDASVLLPVMESQDKLPAGYTECEYLESTGTQYIDTGVYATKQTHFRIVFDWLNGTTVSWMLYAISTADNSGIGFTMSYGGANYGFRHFGSAKGGGGWLGGATNSVVASSTEALPNGLRIGDTLVVTPSQSSAASVAAHTLHIWGQMLNGSVTSVSKARVYSCALSDSGVLIRDFVPALDSDGTPCLYDLVTATPYYNAGTGTFVYQVRE